MSLSSFVRIALCVGVVSSCSDSTGPDDALNVARTRWLQQGPDGYSMVLHRSCECTPQMAGPARIVVQHGAVQFRHYITNGELVPAAFANNFPTVEGLFAIIEGALRQSAFSLVVRYDATFGYPTLISIDYDRQIADDEFTYTTTDLRPLITLDNR